MGGGRGGGALPAPATTASNHHSQPPYSPTVPPFSAHFSTKNSDFIDENEQRTSAYFNGTDFGPVPSPIEVQNAISDLRRVMNGFCPTNSELNGIGQIYDPSRTLVNSLGQKRLLDAYHLLQTDASVQRLVLSISSDRGVWDAILKNNAVQDLQGSLLHTATEEKAMSYKRELDLMSLIVKWIFGITKSKIMEFIEKLGLVVIETLQPTVKKEKPTSKLDVLVEEKVRSSVLLSVVILVIVVVTRSIET